MITSNDVKIRDGFIFRSLIISQLLNMIFFVVMSSNNNCKGVLCEDSKIVHHYRLQYPDL